jgi:hypothetical protein
MSTLIVYKSRAVCRETNLNRSLKLRANTQVSTPPFESHGRDLGSVVVLSVVDFFIFQSHIDYSARSLSSRSVLVDLSVPEPLKPSWHGLRALVMVFANLGFLLSARSALCLPGSLLSLPSGSGVVSGFVTGKKKILVSYYFLRYFCRLSLYRAVDEDPQGFKM